LTSRLQARGLRNAQFPTRARVTYFAEKSLKVDLMYKREDEWTECFVVPDVKLPSVTYLGFSAETGELSDNHDIIKVETKNLYSPSGKTTGSSTTTMKGAGAQKDFSRNKYAGKSGSGQGGGGWGWFLLKFVVFGLVLAGAYVGFTVYRAKKRDRF